VARSREVRSRTPACADRNDRVVAKVIASRLPAVGRKQSSAG
jgi:hypothetical protein